MKHLSLFISLFISLQFVHISVAQKVTLDPEFVVADESVKITYEVTGTALQDLEEAWLWLWLPGNSDHETETNINPASSNPSITDKAKLTRETGPLGEVFFSIEITLTDFTNEPKDKITTVGVLIKGNDWSDGQTSDFLFETTDGFKLVFDNPKGKYGFYKSGDIIEIKAKSSAQSNIDLYIDNKLISSANGTTSLNYSHPVISDGVVHSIMGVAVNSSNESDRVLYKYSLIPNTEEVSIPDILSDGINYDPNDQSKASLVLTAPNKNFVFVIGSFNNWSIDQEYLMKKDNDQFWLEIENLQRGKEYLFQYLVDGEIRIADPYAEKISSQFDDGQIISEARYENLIPYPSVETSEAASYLQTGQTDFIWADFTPPNKEDLIIYEVLVRDFTDERTFDGVLNRLDYLESLGVNALELMPVMEFEGNISWGYNSSSMLAVDKYYGSESQLKTLINECHKRGIAVILDIVLNHQFGRNSLVRLYNQDLYGAPTPDNPWFNVTAKHDFNVGYDMNHESKYTSEYVRRVVSYWINEYNIDGYRFDLSKGFTQKNTLGNTAAWGEYDAFRVDLWKKIADFIWSIDPDNYVILEHFAENDEEKELADYGMMLWGNLNHTYISATSGGSTSLSSLYHASRGWNKPHMVGYMESHDEERQMWSLNKNGWKLNDALQRAKLGAAFFLTVPGPKMIWQFGELGYDEELNNDRLGIKPTHWEYLEDESRYSLLELYRSLVNLRTKTNYINSDYFTWNTSGWVKWITIKHPEVNFYIVGNFNRETRTTNHQFPKSGTWFNYFSGQRIEIADPNSEITLGGGQFYIYTDKEIDNYIDSNPIITLNSKIAANAPLIYPNPSCDKIQIKSVNRPSSIDVRSIAGKSILKIENLEEEQIDISSLPQGIYIITLDFESEKVIEKIIKKR